MKKCIVWAVALLFVAACNSSAPKDSAVFSESLPESEGEQLYLDMRCPTCHGYQGAGDGFLAAGLQSKPVDFSSAEAMEAIPDDQLKAAIREGTGPGMPKYADFTDHQVEALLQYIRSLSHSPL